MFELSRLTLANLSRFTVIWVVFFYSVFAFTLAVIVLLRKADDFHKNLKDFQGCIAVYLSRFIVAFRFGRNVDILSLEGPCVKHYF